MPTRIATEAVEKSTAIIKSVCTDEDGDVVTPNSDVTWSLTDTNGSVINSRSGVSISAASTMKVVLSGNDLALSNQNNSFESRILTMECTYESDLGSGLPFKDSCKFNVVNLKKVS